MIHMKFENKYKNNIIDLIIKIFYDNKFEFIEESIEGTHSQYSNKTCLWFDYIGTDINWYSEDEFNNTEDFLNYSRKNQPIVEEHFKNMIKKNKFLESIFHTYEFEDYRVGYTNIYIYI